jgi:two-component system cell cycle sensor histidine kinase PleC
MPMARAETAHPLGRERAPFSEAGHARPLGIPGLARLLARPAYERFLAAEPFLRRLIPVLIFIFLAIVALLRLVQLIDIRDAREQQAQAMVEMTTAVVAARLKDAEPALPSVGRALAVRDILADVLTPAATQDGRRVIVTDDDGAIIVVAPRDAGLEGTKLSGLLSDAQPLFLFGERAGVMNVSLASGEGALAAANKLSGKLGWAAVIQPTGQMLSAWRNDVSMNVSIFVATSAVLLVILYGYFAQATRAREADRIYAATHERLDMALMRGRCGLWDWDLSRGRLFWSKSMFAILGYPARDELLGFSEVSALMHPDDENLMSMVEALYDSGETAIDRAFRMRHATGEWLWLRARVEMTARDSGEPHLLGIAVDVTEQMRLAESTQTADLRLRDAVEAISEAFVLWDADNRLVLCNSKYRQLHGLSEEDAMRGQPYGTVMAGARQPIIRAQMAAGERDEGGRSFEAQLEDGRWLQINERRTKDGGFVSVGTDITQIKQHEERLMDGERRLVATIADLQRSREALKRQTEELADLAEQYAKEKDRAEEANRTKSEFLANISHELRTPLNAIIGFSEIMRSGMFGGLGSPKYNEYCGDIHDSGTYLLGVINDVLDMSRIEAGRFRLNIEDLLLDDLIDEALRVATAQAEARSLRVTSEVEKNIRFAGDRRALRQILINLLSNAAKFTLNGGRITFRARVVGGAVVLTIGDTGIGIPKSALGKIGRPFEQVQNQFTKSHRGSGLGLAITRSLIELHGGALRIISREGEGTIVSVRMPMSREAAESA